MNNLYDFLQRLTTEQVQQALNQAQTFDRNSVPLNKLKALDDCADVGEKLYHAMKELDTDCLKTLGLGFALLRRMQCQQEDQNKQRGTLL